MSDPTDEELAAAGRDRETFEAIVRLHAGNREQAKLTIQKLAAVRARHREESDG